MTAFKTFLSDLFAVAAVVGTEAWFLQGYYAGKPEYEPAIAFVAALGILLAKEPLKARFGGTDTARAHDRALFQEFQRVLPIEPTIRTLRDHDFGNSVRKQAIDPLHEFHATWESVDKEFLDSKLEGERKALYRLAGELASEIARRTVPVGSHDQISVFSDRQREENHGRRPPAVLEDARILNEKASDFVPKYEAFVRLCRKRLTQ